MIPTSTGAAGDRVRRSELDWSSGGEGGGGGVRRRGWEGGDVGWGEGSCRRSA